VRFVKSVIFMYTLHGPYATVCIIFDTDTAQFWLKFDGRVYAKIGGIAKFDGYVDKRMACVSCKDEW
jgi:hypothetical protein